MNKDAIAIVEAAYDLDLDTRGWLAQILERAAPRLDQGFGLTANIYHVGKGGTDESTMVLRQMDPRLNDAILRLSRVQADQSDRNIDAGRVLATVSQRMGLTPEAMASFEGAVAYLHPLGVRDILGVTVVDPGGRA